MLGWIGEWAANRARQRYADHCIEATRRYTDACVADELSTLRADNARMHEELAAIRKELGLDEDGDIFEALNKLADRFEAWSDALEARKALAEYRAQDGYGAHTLESITLDGKPLDLSGYPKDAPVKIAITTDPDKTAGIYAEMIGAASYLLTPEEERGQKREGEPA